MNLEICFGIRTQLQAGHANCNDDRSPVSLSAFCWISRFAYHTRNVTLQMSFLGTDEVQAYMREAEGCRANDWLVALVSEYATHRCEICVFLQTTRERRNRKIPLESGIKIDRPD